ncbi:MAG TPA: NAD-dependent epimerase/dehydratase family protein [Thermoleophilaceae bacterium]
MRVVVVGATGNVGTSVLRALSAEPQVDSIVGVARRVSDWHLEKVEWQAADIRSSNLVALFEGADVVVHLAWLIQPSRDHAELRSVNVEGSARLFDAVAEAQVPALVYASSVGAYSPGPKDRAVDESWPTDGIQSSFYARHKAEVERLLDRFEQDHPEVRSVRLRPALIFKREAGSEIRRLFAGPFLPSRLVRKEAIPVVPDIPRLRFQAVHSYDVGEAYRLVALGDAAGAFNIAADPVLDPPELARLLDARTVPVPAGLVRTVADLSWRLRLQPTPPGWVDMALAVPIMDPSRARKELGWEPRRSSGEAVLDVLAGIRESPGEETPPLAADAGGPARAREIATGVGRENP